MSTILDFYDWDRGDMIYGIGEEINKYIRHLLKNGKLAGKLNPNKFKETKYVAINTFNRALAF